MLRRHFCLTLVLASALLTHHANARDEQLHFPIAVALKIEGKTKLDSSIQLFFGNQSHPKAKNTFGNFISNKKTNAFGKSDATACNWAFLSAVLELQERARKEGGNAVINISSFYKKNVFNSDSEFECGAGSIMAGVALKGDVVTLP